MNWSIGDKAASRWSGYTVTIKDKTRGLLREWGYAVSVWVYLVEFDDGSRGLLGEADLVKIEEVVA